MQTSRPLRNSENKLHDNSLNAASVCVQYYYRSKNRKYSTGVELGPMLMHKLKIHLCAVKGMLWLTRQWLVHHLFSGRNVNSARHLRAPPPCCSASYFTLAHYFQESPTPLSVSIALCLPLCLPPFPSIISIHPSLVEASQRGSGCCVRGILGLWRQFENEARLHLNTLLSGHLVNLMRGGWGGERREEVVGWRERGGGRGSNCNTEREEVKRGREESEGGSVWRTLANINSLCKSAAQTNWQAGITPERSWIKSMKALAPLTLDLQPRPVHRSVPVMHTNDSGGAGRTVTSQHVLFSYSGSWRQNPTILHLRWNVNHPERKTLERREECVLTEVDPHTTYTGCSGRPRLFFLPISEEEYLNSPNPGSNKNTISSAAGLQTREDGGWYEELQSLILHCCHCVTASTSPFTTLNC